MKKTITYLLLLFAAVTMNAQEWENVGTPSSPDNSVYSDPWIKFDHNGTAYIAFYQSGIRVKKLNGTVWEMVGTPVPVASDLISGTTKLAFDANNTPYIAFAKQSQGDYSFEFRVMKFNGNSWEHVATAPSLGDEYALSFAVDNSGAPHISYKETGSGMKTLKFNGTAWETLGESITSGSYHGASLIIGPDDMPYLAYKEAAWPYSSIVVRFNGSAWETVGSPPPPGSNIGSFNWLSVDRSGTLYLSYGRTVRKYNGVSWEFVGPEGSLPAAGQFLVIAFNNDGTPYVTFRNQENWKASVMKFNGTSWEYVGTPYISYYDVDSTSIGIDPLDNIYVCYTDAVSVVVKKFTPPCNIPAPQFEGAVPTCTEGTFADIKVFAPQLNFYASEAADTALGEDDAIVPGTYYISQTFGCESPRSPVDIVAGDCHARTQLEAASCGVTLPQIDTKIYATAVPSAEAYLFAVSDGTHTQNVYSPYRYFRLIQMEQGYAYNTTYTIRVVAIVNGQPGFAGAACTVTTPVQSTTLTAASCNSTVVNFGTNIYANSRSFAEGYRFRITNGENVQTVDRPNTYFRLNQLATYGYGITYTVEVAVMINGEYGEYGPACTVTTPTAISKLKDSSCGITVARFSTNLYATALPLAEGYRFMVTDESDVQYIEGSASYFRLSQLASYHYNTAYTVHVAVKINGSYGSFGQGCTVTTPAPLTQLRAQDCGTTVATFGTNLYADSMLLATGYRFRVTNGAVVNIVDRPNKNFRISMLPSYTYNTTYTVEVAVLVDGVWGDYGTACEVSTPVSGMRQNMANDEVAVRELTAFPNPFETSFTLALETESDEAVTIQAYDISGKMLDNRTVAPEELSDLKIGENYAAGIYSVIVSQGAYAKVVKMVKK